jgi:hypothetical protein
MEETLMPEGEQNGSIKQPDPKNMNGKDETDKNQTAGEPSAPLLSADQRLTRFLQQENLTGVREKLLDAGFAFDTIENLQSALADEKLRKEMAAKLDAKKGDVEPTFEDKLLAAKLRGYTASSIKSAVGKFEDSLEPKTPPAPASITPKVNTELKKYLQDNGFPEEQMPVFEKHGAVSLQTLRNVMAEESTKNGLRDSLKDGGDFGGKKLVGSEAAAKLFDDLKVSDVDSKIEKRPSAQSPILDETEIKRYNQLKAAVQEVETLRKQQADNAGKLADGIEAKVQKQLTEILAAVNSEALFKKFDGKLATMSDLNTELDKVQSALGAKAADIFSEATKNVEKHEVPTALANANHLHRGMLITATGIYECTGSDLVKGNFGTGTPRPYEEVNSNYASESSYEFAKKTIKISSSTDANSAGVMGGVATSSGIGAISLGFQYAQSKMENKATAVASRTGRAVRVQESTIVAPKAIITLPRDKMELSLAAVDKLILIAKTEREDLKKKYARDFTENFGTHVFRSVTLGGRYSYVARAETKSQEDYNASDEAFSEAKQTAASAGFGFFGKFLLGISDAHEHRESRAGATSATIKTRNGKQSVTVNIVVNGGVQELPIQEWKRSLAHNAFWRAIDRRDPIAIWDILEYTTITGLTLDEQAKVSALLEEIWVQEIFLASLRSVSPEIARIASVEKFKDIKTVADLESKVRELLSLTAPPMKLVYFKAEDKSKEWRFGEMVVTLPENYKLLSAGGGSIEGKSQCIAENYPQYDGKRWSWHLKMRADIFSGQNDKGIRVSLVAIDDPNNEWDVSLFSSEAADMRPDHEWSVSAALGYVITGGGAKVSKFDRPMLSGCGFTPGDAEAVAAGGSLDVFSAKSYLVRNSDEDKDDKHRQDHKLACYAIGIKPRNGAALQSRYSLHKVEKKQHPEGVVNYSQVSPANTLMLGGGVWVTGKKNFLSATYPDIDANTGHCKWVGRSQDHHVSAPEEMMLVAIGLDGVHCTIRDESNNPGNKWNVVTNTNLKEN